MEDSLRNNILKVQELEIDIKNHKKILEKKCKELETLQNNCSHNIIMVADYCLGYWVKSKCLFCGETFGTPHELREFCNSLTLEAHNCKKFVYCSEEYIYKAITFEANTEIKLNPNISLNDLFDHLKKFISE